MQTAELLPLIESLTHPPVIELADSLSPEVRDDLMNALRHLGFHVFAIRLSGRQANFEALLIEELDHGFRFPDYFGENWNAVDECINDLSWLPATGYCFFLSTLGSVSAHSASVMKLLLTVVADASAQWAQNGRRFCVVVER